MRKIFVILSSLIMIFGLSSCGLNKTRLVISDVEITDEAIDKEKLETYLLSKNENYSELKSNAPNLLDHVKTLKSDLNKNSQLLKFSYDGNGYLDGATILRIDNSYYNLGVAFGGFGVTQFAHYKNGNKDLLYWGSGIHRSHVGVFDLNRKVIGDVNLNLGLSQSRKDFTFVKKIGNTFNLHYASINWNHDDRYTYIIKKEKLFYSNVENASIEFQTTS